MIEALATLLERYSTPRLSRRTVGKERDRIARAIEYMAHLCRRFRQIVGVTPGEYARGTAASRTAPPRVA